MRDLYDHDQDSTPLPRFVPAHHAERAALRSFWRGVFTGVAIGAVSALAVWVAV